VLAAAGNKLKEKLELNAAAVDPWSSSPAAAESNNPQLICLLLPH
jgi:hypothetical protein